VTKKEGYKEAYIHFVEVYKTEGRRKVGSKKFRESGEGVFPNKTSDSLVPEK